MPFFLLISFTVFLGVGVDLSFCIVALSFFHILVLKGKVTDRLVHSGLLYGSPIFFFNSVIFLFLQSFLQSDGSLGSMHRRRSQRIAKSQSCELQDTFSLRAAEHLTY